MCGRKPHLLVRADNNLGAETRIEYASSTKFYLADKAAGMPWVTRLPFPVHVVERVETYDYISRNRFVTRYTYHHGFYDGVEREFRGFGRVDQLDTEELGALTASGAFPVGENIDPASNIPPVLTKTWFHTGAYLQRGRISRHLAHEYYREPGLSDAQIRAMLLEDTVLPARVTPEEAREACRSLKGAMLRQEVYAVDQTAATGRPYTVSESNLTIRMLQQRWSNRHAVFLTHTREAVTFHYDRKLYATDAGYRADPRRSHELTLEVDEYGNVLKSVAVAYGRRFPDPSPVLSEADRQTQARTLMTLTENNYTNPVRGPDAYRTSLPAESCTYELLQVQPPTAHHEATSLFRFDDMRAKVQAAGDGRHDIPYEHLYPTALRAGQPYRRLIERMRTLYRPDDLGASHGDPAAQLPLGRLESRALLGNAYKLAFTSGLIAQVYKREGTALLPSPRPVFGGVGGGGGGYVDLDHDGNWWVASGRVYYHPNPDSSPARELAEARRHFFTPRRFVNQFGKAATIDFDSDDLLVIRSTDAVENTSAAVNDYRVLQPTLLTDPNGNREAAAFDALGLVTGTAVMGKVTEEVGDSLADFDADLQQPAIDDFFFADDPHSVAGVLLRSASTRIVYDLDRFATTRGTHPEDPMRWEPAYTAMLARETHASETPPLNGLRSQIGLSYSDGFGREIQKKVQSEPGPVIDQGPTVDPRWVGSGWTIFNNKGKPVRQFEPFFSQLTSRGHRFEFGLKAGVSPILFYDPVMRVVAIVHPNRTFEKVVFDPWREESWDVNDTVLISDPGADADVGQFLRRLPAADYLPTWYEHRIAGEIGPAEAQAARKAARHADTPASGFVDSLGRAFLTIGDNGHDRKNATRTVLDIEGNHREVIDAFGRLVKRCSYDMLGTAIRRATMDGGERWMLTDVLTKPIRAWNARRYAFLHEYDALRRPHRSFVEGGDAREREREVFPQPIVYESTIYGDSTETGLSPEQLKQFNLRTRVVRHLDTAGILTTDLYDFKGNSLQSKRQFACDYKATADWSHDPSLENVTFTTTTAYDALNRVVASTSPDGSIYRPTYNEANLLDRVDVNLRGSEQDGELLWTPFVVNIDYNARGERVAIRYANRTDTLYEYDDETFRVLRLRTTRGAPGNGLATKLFNHSGVLQDLRYTYDPVGNITRIVDAALQTVFHANQRVEATCEYTYDPLYRLIEAGGRENIGQVAFQLSAPNHNDRDYPFVGASSLRDLQAVRNFTERYDYDAVGNIERMVHRAGPSGNWTRNYFYDEASPLETGWTTNRLRRTELKSNAGAAAEPYRYDVHGNIIQMSHLPVMAWDFRDQLSVTSPQVTHADAPEMTYYVYDATGQRARKVTERADGGRKIERLYMGGFEVYRAFGGGDAIVAERQTLHVMDDQQRIALVETQTVKDRRSIAAPTPLPRYQLANQLGSVSLELDDSGTLITYEEYSPYGCGTFQAGSAAEVSLKRYRYTGKERDKENGFTYHGARYYAPWLGRWTAVDPAHASDGSAPYVYVQGRPIIANDPNGRFLNIVIGAAVGFLIGGGVEMARQLITEGRITSWSRVGASAAGGLVGGAIAGATMGASLAVEAAGVAIGSAAGGTVTRLLNRETTTPAKVGVDIAVGLATFGLLRGAGAGLRALRGAAAEGAEGGSAAAAGEAPGPSAGGARGTPTEAAGPEPGAPAEPTAPDPAKPPAPTVQMPRLQAGNPGQMLRESADFIMRQAPEERQRLLADALKQVKEAFPGWKAAPGTTPGGGVLYAGEGAPNWLYAAKTGEVFQGRELTHDLIRAVMADDIEGIRRAMQALPAGQAREWLPAAAITAAPVAPASPMPAGASRSGVPLWIGGSLGTQADKTLLPQRREGVVLFSW